MSGAVPAAAPGGTEAPPPGRCRAADLMINSACDPATGAVHAFEEQIGSHGGLEEATNEPSGR
ncbi:hypothetical protein ACH4NT_25550 [Streptomyces lydicus]|uniref:hypothetical protein n=1 Tax=Streptomyces lydicus TaxID=47763 RepID=UPI0037B61EC4